MVSGSSNNCRTESELGVYDPAKMTGDFKPDDSRVR